MIYKLEIPSVCCGHTMMKTNTSLAHFQNIIIDIVCVSLLSYTKDGCR